MKKYLVLSLLLFSTSIFPGTVIPIYISRPVQEKKIKFYSARWLYDLYEQSPNDIVTKQIQDDIGYFTNMMSNYMDDLSQTVEQQNTILAKKATKNIVLFAVAAGLFSSSKWLYPKFMFPRDINNYVIFGFAFSLTSALVTSTVACMDAYDLITYKKDLAHRYEVGKKILAQLKEAETRLTK